MIRWRVIDLKTKAIWVEYVQDNPPKWDGSWPPEGQYFLDQHLMDASERREWARQQRQVILKERSNDFLEAVLFNALGDSEFLSALKQELTDLLLKYPKDPQG